MQFIVSYHTELPVGTVEVNGFCDSDDTSISLTARDAIGWACWCWCCNYWSEFASVSDGRRRSISWRRHIDWKTNQASDSAHGLVLTLVSQFGYTQCQIRVATCRVTLSMLLLCVACFFVQTLRHRWNRTYYYYITYRIAAKGGPSYGYWPNVACKEKFVKMGRYFRRYVYLVQRQWPTSFVCTHTYACCSTITTLCWLHCRTAEVCAIPSECPLVTLRLHLYIVHSRVIWFESNVNAVQICLNSLSNQSSVCQFARDWSINEQPSARLVTVLPSSLAAWRRAFGWN